jgi:hypothetical protein
MKCLQKRTYQNFVENRKVTFKFWKDYLFQICTAFFVHFEIKFWLASRVVRRFDSRQRFLKKNIHAGICHSEFVISVKLIGPPLGDHFYGQLQ